MKTILVAEDRESSRELIRTQLEHSGYCVIEAANGAEAVFLARQNSPDLLLLDLHMPNVDGFDVSKELRSEPRFKSIPIVAYTASTRAGSKDRALSNGFTCYLTKPLSLFELRRELSRLLPE